MRVRWTSAFSLLFVAFAIGTAHAQVHESATGSDRHLWAGGEFSDFKPDYGLSRLDGIGFYADYLVTHRYGAEAEIRLLDLNKPAGETQKTFMAGPIANIYQYHKAIFYAKFLLGVGTVNYPDNIGYGSYFAFAPGGGVEYRFAPRWKVRGEYEAEFFPSAPGAPITYPFPSNGLTPTGFSVGISYKIF